MKALFAFSVALALAFGSASAADQELAFPGAEGFGAAASGGRGGETVHVTTLADSGTGSFREAVSKQNRIVVFDVGGVIKLKSNLAVSSNLTIDGQSAPADGITCYGHSVSLSGQKNVILRYIRCREGINGDRGKCSINMADAHNCIVDHCSIEWGRWDCLDLTKGSTDVTFQYCIIGQSIDPQRFGALVDSVERVTFSHNLWIHNHSRNPKAKGTIQYVNNVIYDWGITGLAGGHSGADHQLDAINNVLIKGPSSNNQAAGGFTSTDHVYMTGNLVDLDRSGTFHPRPLTPEDFHDKNGDPTFDPQPHLKPTVAVTTQPAEEALKTVIAQAGASAHRDAVDLQLIDEVKSNGKLGKIIKSEEELAAMPKADTPPQTQPAQ